LSAHLESNLHSLEEGIELGLMTGFLELDNLLCGFKPKELIYLVARPSTGKTALALQTCVHMAMNGTRVLFISLETGIDTLLKNFMSSHFGINRNKLHSGRHLSDADWTRIHARKDQVREIDSLKVIDRTGLNVHQIKAEAQKMLNRGGLDLLVVDHFHLADHSVFKMPRADLNQAQTSLRLQWLSKELGIPILCLAQLNRSLESRQNQQPTMSDFRECGSAEQDANVILALSPHPNPMEAIKNIPSLAKLPSATFDNPLMNPIRRLNILKNKTGPRGSVDFFFEAPFLRFTALETMILKEQQRYAQTG